MQEFIQDAAQSLGITEDVAGKATGGVFKLLQKHVDGGDFQSLMDALPGAGDLVAAAPEPGGGGGLGGLMGAAGSLMGGNAGLKLEAASMLDKVGLSTDKAVPFVSMLFEFVKQRAGDDLIAKLAGQVPQLASLMG